MKNSVSKFLKKSVIVLLFAVCGNSYAQDFINNPDYVYAYGNGKTMEEAENSAIISLSTAIKVDVANTTVHTITEANNVIDEYFNKNVSTNSSIVLDDAVKTYIKSSKKGKYEVYKYINKKEYVSAHKESSEKYIKEAIALETSDETEIKHKKNLLLGYYYLAYSELDTPLMNIWSDNEGMKEELYRRDSIIFYSSEFGVLNLRYKSKYDDTYEVANAGKIIDAQPIGLTAFEYYAYGEWHSPMLFSDDIANDSYDRYDNYDKIYRKCVIHSTTNKIKVRYIYEIKKGQIYAKINVPEDWYFHNDDIFNLRMLK